MPAATLEKVTGRIANRTRASVRSPPFLRSQNHAPRLSPPVTRLNEMPGANALTEFRRERPPALPRFRARRLSPALARAALNHLPQLSTLQGSGAGVRVRMVAELTPERGGSRFQT